MTPIEQLIAKLEAASEGSRELDGEIAIALGWSLWRSKHGYWNFDGPDKEHHSTFGDPQELRFDPDTGKRNAGYDVPPLACLADRADVAAYTTSFDAAVTLVQKGWRWYGGQQSPNRRGAFASVTRNIDSTTLRVEDVSTPVLALCIAALKALSA